MIDRDLGAGGMQYHHVVCFTSQISQDEEIYCALYCTEWVA